MSRFLVTGGAGFIGSAIVRRLLAGGADHVVVVDSLLTGYEHNLADVRADVDFRLADIRRYEEIAPAFQGVDVVFHEAAIPSVPRSIDDPVPSHEVNIDGTFNVLRAAVAGGVRRVVYAASSSAYGDTEVLPKVETMNPQPKSPYALQKLVGEYYMNVFASTYGVETVSLRYFNVYGPRQDPSSAYSGVLSLFMKSVLERRSPTIFGDGEQSRDFTYVEDVAELNWKAAHVPGVSGRMYNAGNGGRITLNQAWEMLQQIENVSIPAKYGPPRAGDVRDSQADIARAVSDLGHAPQFTFEQGMRRTLEVVSLAALTPMLARDAHFLRGRDFFNCGEYFACHEVWEDLWRPARPPQRLFLQALIHLAVAAHHSRQGNPEGAARQWTKGLKKLAGYLPTFEGVDTWTLYRTCATMQPGSAPPPLALRSGPPL